jgi:acetyl esterase/lipase
VSYLVKEIAGVRTYIVTPKTVNARWGDRVFVHTHGGAFVFGGGDSALREAVWVAHGGGDSALREAVWVAHGLGVKVVSVDYRRPPIHPFPAAIEDALAVWRQVTKGQDAAGTALFGTSAGGNIAGSRN